MSRAEREEGGRSEKRLKVIEQRFRILLDSAPDGMVIVGRDGRIALVNAQAESLFGSSRDELVGQPVETLVALDHRPALRERVIGLFESSSEPTSAAVGLDLVALRRDGTEFPVEIRLSPARTAEGGVVMAAVRDVTERERAEQTLRRTEEHLRQVQKMEAVGRLAGGIAHDFNNVLSVILSYAGFLTDAIKTDELRSDIDEIRKAADRAVQLTRQLLAFSREQPLTPRVVSLNEIVVGLEKMLRRMTGDAVDLTFVPDPSLGMIRADPGQVEQVIVNLVVNARDAMPAGGRIVIETTRLRLADGQAPPRPEMAAGEYAVLAVTDTGIGMDEATREHVFEPFFTTKGKGTGLGLSVVYGIIAQSGGHVVVDSEPGKGTTFRLYLPQAGEIAEASISPLPSRATGGSETVLLVEDDEQVRAVVATILRRNGYTVVEARNAGEAFVACEQHASPIDLLLSDVVMPRMSGHELAARLLPSHPDMRVLFMSGHPDSERLDADMAVFEHMEKPMTADALLGRVRAVLDRSPPRGQTK